MDYKITNATTRKKNRKWFYFFNEVQHYNTIKNE